MSNDLKDKKPNLLFWVFAAIGVLGVLVVIFIAISIMNFGNGGRDEPARLVVAEGEMKYALGDITDLGGTNLTAISIVTDQKMLGSGSMKGYNRPLLHNLVLYDRESKKSRKLLKDHRGLIKSALFLTDNEKGIPLDIGRMMDDATEIADAVAEAAMMAEGFETEGQSEDYRKQFPLKHYLAIVAERDGDKMPTKLLLGRLSDGKQTTVMVGIEAIERFWIMSPTELGLIVQEKGEVFHRVINFETLTVAQSTKIEVN